MIKNINNMEKKIQMPCNFPNVIKSWDTVDGIYSVVAFNT